MCVLHTYAYRCDVCTSQYVLTLNENNKTKKDPSYLCTVQTGQDAFFFLFFFLQINIVSCHF